MPREKKINSIKHPGIQKSWKYNLICSAEQCVLFSAFKTLSVFDDQCHFPTIDLQPPILAMIIVGYTKDILYQDSAVLLTACFKKKRKKREDRFQLLWIKLANLSPISSSLTTAGTSHRHTNVIKKYIKMDMSQLWHIPSHFDFSPTKIKDLATTLSSCSQP